MNIENLIEKFKLEKGIDIQKAVEHNCFWTNSLRVSINKLQVNTFEQRVELINKITEIEHQRLMDDKESWAITGLKKISGNWIEFDFDYGKEMLFNAFRFDLAYSRSERLPVDIAQKFYDLIISGYKKESTFIYCNYNNSPWDQDSGGYSGWNLTDDWTFDLGIVLINSDTLTFNYFLSED